MCGAVREEHQRTLDMGIFDKSKQFCTVRKGSPYYRKKIQRAQERVEKAKLVYEEYRDRKRKIY